MRKLETSQLTTAESKQLVDASHTINKPQLPHIVTQCWQALHSDSSDVRSRSLSGTSAARAWRPE